jgi:PAS domain S-box-containing protein
MTPPLPTLSPTGLARLIDLAEDAIVSATADGRIVLFNRGAERTFGYDRQEVIGQPLDVLIPQRFVAAHRRHVETFGGCEAAARWMGERSAVYGLRKDGTEFPAEVTISKSRDNDILFLNAIVRDVTVRKRIEQEIRALNQDLEERVAARTAELAESYRSLARKNEENEAFVYSVSHDLRSPLVNLEGFSQELATACDILRKILDDPGVPSAVRESATAVLDGDMTESIQYIQNAVDRLSRIIDALLRLSRIGRVEFRHQLVDVAGVVDQVVQSLRVTIEEKGANITVQPLPPAWGDPVAIEQVFANLIGNALKYLDPNRTGQITIEPAESDSSDYYAYRVRDNGVGIPQAHSAQLFQAFRRLHPHLAPGEGIGLALTRRMVERLGGKIWYEPAGDGGSCFVFTLPATATPDTQQENAP